MSAEIHFLSRLRRHSPTWMPRPDSWLWRTPEGTPQGFARSWRDSPGSANLLWLAIDFDHPPAEYDARQNNLAMLLIAHGRQMTLDALPLLDQAGSLTLQQFRDLLQSAPFTSPTHNIAPLLAMLATRRLDHAHA